MIVTVYDYRMNPQKALQWIDEVLAGSSTGCIEIRRSRSFVSKFFLYVATAIQRYFSGHCVNCGAKKITHRHFLICPYCELVPPRKQ